MDNYPDVPVPIRFIHDHKCQVTSVRITRKIFQIKELVSI